MKRLFPLIFAASLIPSVHAEPVPHSFSFVGFYHVQSSQWLPTARINGSFEAEDLDGNGLYDRSEVSSFWLGDQPYIGGCREADICGLWTFSYARGGPLNFDAGWGVFGSNFEAYAGGSAKTGDRISSFSPSGVNTYLWRPETVFAITPVPEPATYMMLAGGLALLALRRRFRLER